MYNNINLNLYKTFYEVAKYGSISEAAKKTYTSQPALSKSIKKLEEDLGVQLFYRNLGGIELTNKGKELLFYVEEAFNNLVVAQRNMFESENLEKGKITIGVPSQIGTFFVFDKVSLFHEKYPNIEITIISSSTKDLLEKLNTHEIDFIIDSSPIEKTSDQVIIKPLKTVNNCFIVKKDTNLDVSNIKSIKDISNYPLILPILGTSNRKKLDELFEEKQVNLTNVMNIHTSEMILGAVKRNLGIGYIIEDLIIDDSDVLKLNIKEKLPSIKINLVYVKKYLTTAPTKFIKMFIDEKFSE